MQNTQLLIPLAAILFAGGSVRAEQPELIWMAPGIENIVCLEAIDDVDGDGRPDIVFESYDAGAPQADHLVCIRGASSGAGEVLWGVRPPGGASSGGGYGDNCLRIAPDLTGDGHADVLLGTAWGGRSAYAIDGTGTKYFGGPEGYQLYSFGPDREKAPWSDREASKDNITSWGSM